MQHLSPNTELSKLYKQIRSVAFGVGRNHLFWMYDYQLWDWVHDATTNVLLNLAQFRGESEFRYWVVVALKNQAKYAMQHSGAERRDQRREVYIDAQVDEYTDDEPEWLQVQAQTPLADEQLIAREELTRALSLLTPLEHEILGRICYQGESIPQMVLDGWYTHGQLKWIVRNARKRLRETL